MLISNKLQSEKEESVEQSAIRVLVVDANSRQAAATRRALKEPPADFVVSPARQIWSAVQILSGVPIDVVLLSLDLARGEGSSAKGDQPADFAGLKSLQRVSDEMPILVMGSDLEQGESALGAGAADFLNTSTHFGTDVLRQRILEAFERRAAAIAAVSQGAQTATPMRILLVDEDSLVLRLLRRNLEHRGHLVTPLQSPHEAIEFVKGASFGFDLLVCDERLGGMEGERLRQLLRRYAPALRSLFFCSQVGSFGVENSSPMSSEFYLRKPYDLEEFGEVLDVIEAGYPWVDGRASGAGSDSVFRP
ncbi:response regulator [Bradymonas sediminis]|nr:response regulator [Bradymonas sediminis]TDP77281.1 CheY-like chemotaxis protein [Bradymonas sediminis]